jgi:molybdopterin converting factor small subunit
MIVNVKLYATLRKLAPKNVQIGEAFPLDLDSPTVNGVLHKLGIDEKQAKIIMVNGTRVTKFDLELHTNDTVVIFPPVGGG